MKKKSFLLKRSGWLFAILLCIILIIHLFLASQAINSSANDDDADEVSWALALERNEVSNDAKPPSQIVVIGEIHSGAEYATEILKNAFGNETTHLHESILYHHELLDDDELKIVAARTDILWVITVRSPCHWTDAVIKSRKELCEEMEDLSGDACKAYPHASEEDYYRMPWYDVHQISSVHEAIESSNDIIDKQYEDIFDMRRQKLLLLKQIIDVMPRHAKILRLGEFELNPNAFIMDLVTEYNFTTIDEYKLYLPAVEHESTFSCMEHSKWKDAQQRIDWTLEGYFGHNHLDCHLCHHDTTPTTSNIYLLGERNSGTTFVSNTLAKAFDPPNTMGSDAEKFAFNIPVVLHKHMFRHDLLDSTELAEIKSMNDIIWVMVVRSPCEWAEAMFRKPYHLCPPREPERCGPSSDPNKVIWMNQNTVSGWSLLQFFTEMEWGDWPESVPFWRAEKGTGETISISKVSSNYTYPNVFELRRHKLQIMKQIIDAVPNNVKLVRLNEVERSPEVFIQDVVREFDLIVKEDYQPQPNSPITHTTVCLTPEEWEAAQHRIDWNLEAEFGFGPSDCRMCYGYDKSKGLFTRVQEGKKIKKIIDEQQSRKGRRWK